MSVSQFQSNFHNCYMRKGDRAETIRTPSWLKRLPGWHRSEDLDRHPEEIARRLFRQGGRDGGGRSASSPLPATRLNWEAEFSLVMGAHVQLEKLATPSHDKACLLPYTSTLVSLQAQVESSATVSEEICRMAPLKQQFANVLRASQASARAHASALINSLGSSADKNKSKRPIRPPRDKSLRASTSPRRRSSMQALQELPSSASTISEKGRNAPENATQGKWQGKWAATGNAARRPTFTQVEYKTLKPADRVRRRLKQYRDNPALAQSLFDRTRKSTSSAKAVRQKERKHIQEWLSQHTQRSGLDAKISAARERYWLHWQHIMDERVASRDRFSPERVERRLKRRRVERLVVAIVLGSRAHRQHRRLRLVRERRERWQSMANSEEGGDPVEAAATIMQRWFRWAPKPFVRKLWLEANGAFYLRRLAEYRVQKGADTVFAFLRDLNRRCLGFKTRNGKSIDLRLLMHRFFHQVLMVQRCVRRFTVVRNARLDMLQRKWEQVEWDLAVIRRDRHVDKLRLARSEERLARERERAVLECELAAITEDGDSVPNGKGADAGDGNIANKDTLQVLANTSTTKLSFSDLKGDGMTSQARNNRRRKASLSSGGQKSRHRGSKAGASAKKMKSLMEAQLSQALRSNSNRTKRKTGRKQTTSTYNTRLKTKRHCAQTTKLANMTTDELAALLAESLDNKDEETVAKVLDVVDGEHDDLDTPSGGFAVEDFMERVDGDLRRDALSSWLRVHLRKARAHCDKIHAMNMDAWYDEMVRIDVEDLNIEKHEDETDDGDEGEDGRKDFSEGGANKDEEGELNETEEDENKSWSQMRSILAKRHINLDLNLRHGNDHPPPVYPPLLLLTGPNFDEIEFHSLVQTTLDRKMYG